MEVNDMVKFREIHQAINDADEICLQDVLEEILHKIGMNDKEFQKNFDLHTEDPEKKKQVVATIEEAAVDRGEGNKDFKEKTVTMSKSEVFAAQKAL